MSAPYPMSPADEQVHELVAEVRRLRERVEALERRQPPEGWSPSNYTCDGNVQHCLARDAVGVWTVWGRGGEALAAGPTPAAAVRALRGAS